MHIRVLGIANERGIFSMVSDKNLLLVIFPHINLQTNFYNDCLMSGALIGSFL